MSQREPRRSKTWFAQREEAMARSAEDDAKTIMRMMVTKGAKPGPYENSMLVQNAVWLGIEGPDLDSARSFAGQQGWIENGVNDTPN